MQLEDITCGNVSEGKTPQILAAAVKGLKLCCGELLAGDKGLHKILVMLPLWMQTRTVCKGEGDASEVGKGPD